MKNIIALTAAAALASAQVTPYPDGTFKCAKPDAAYCAGDSLGTDIIIRCNKDSVGQPGRCGNNLAGQPPIGVGGAVCYQSSPTAGDAACVKNCVVYAPSSTWTLPAALCTPTYTASSSSKPGTTTTIIIETPYPSLSTTTFIDPPPKTSTKKPTVTTTTTTCSTSTSHSKPTSTTTTTTCSSSTPYTKPPVTTTTKTTDCPSTTTYVEPTKYPHHNSTLTTKTSSTTYVPTTRPPVTTAGAANNKAMGGLAAVGLLAAYFL